MDGSAKGVGSSETNVIVPRGIFVGNVFFDMHQMSKRIQTCGVCMRIYIYRHRTRAYVCISAYICLCTCACICVFICIYTCVIVNLLVSDNHARFGS